MIKFCSINAGVSLWFLSAALVLSACAGQQPGVSTSLQQSSASVDAMPVMPVQADSDGQQPDVAPVVSPQTTTPRVVEPKLPPTVSRQDVVWIQERLQELGYYSGAVDGTVGKATRAAIETYQQDQGVTPDGQPTAELREFMWRNGG